MAEQEADPLGDALQRQRALPRWDDDGGAGPDGPTATLGPASTQPPFPRLDDAEFEALHVRVIALENLVVALLAGASGGGREQARGMASYISPRPGFTHHPLTTHAATHMLNLVERAVRFGGRPKRRPIPSAAAGRLCRLHAGAGIHS